MAFTKVVGPGIHTLSNILSHNINSSGIITATKFVGPFDNAIIGGGTTISSDGINVTGIVTATGLDVNGNGDISGNLVVGGNLTANGDFTTLNTTLREVELLRVDAQDDNVAAGIITQRGTGDILNLYDTSSEVFSVADGGSTFMSGSVTINRTTGLAGAKLSITKEADTEGIGVQLNQSSGITTSLTTFNSAGSQIFDLAHDTDSTPDLIFKIKGSSEGAPVEKVRITSAGSVGIGTTNPDTPLHIYANDSQLLTVERAANTNSSIRFRNSVASMYAGLMTNAAGFAIDSDDNLSVSPMFMVRQSNGNVGINTEIPAEKLSVEDSSPAILINATSATGESKLQFGRLGNTNVGEIKYEHSNNAFTFRTNDGADRLRINSDGDVLISHTTTPSADIKLLVGGNAGVTDGKYFSFRASYGNTSEPAAHAIKFDSAIGSSGGLHYYGYGGMYFDLGGQPRVTFTQAGLVGIGTTNPQTFLHLKSDDPALRIQRYNQSAYGDITADTAGKITFKSDPGGAASGDGFSFTVDNSEKFSITSTGDIIAKGEIAAAQQYPNFRPTVDFNFAAQKKLDPRITYQRTGVASFTDEFGKVVLVGDNAPRFDHDPDTKESKGLLIEESRTNLFPYGTTPGDLWNSSKSGTFEENTTETTAPDGTFTATKWTFTNTDPYLYHAQTLSANTSYTVTMYVKAGTNMAGDYVQIRIGASPYSPNGDDITVPTDGTWKRISYTKTVGGSAENSANVGFEPQVKPSGNPASGDVIYIWGAQLEAGSFATSFIPTYGTTVTRGDDTVRIMDDDFTDIFGTEFENFSVVADFDNSNSLDSDNASILEWWSDNTNYEDRIQIMKDNSSPYHIETRAFGGNTAMFSNGNLSASSKAATNRFATSWSVDYTTNNAANRRWAFSFSGEEVDVVNDNTGTNVPALTRFGIGCSPRYLNLTKGVLLFKRLMVYNQTLSDSQLQNLSAR